MPSPRNAQIIALLLTLSFVTGTKAQTTTDKPPAPAQKSEAKQTDASKQKKDYSHEAVVIEQLSCGGLERNRRLHENRIS